MSTPNPPLDPFSCTPVEHAAIRALTVIFAAECIRQGVRFGDVVDHLRALYDALEEPP